MTWLILGLVVLIGVHLVPAVPPLRRALIQRLGFMPYKGLFSLIALAGLVLIVIGKARAPFIPLWEPPEWGKGSVPLFMLPAFILLAGAYLPGNAHRLTPHPMLWGVILWAVGHLLANGDAASALLFGSLGLYSAFAIWSANRRGAARATVRMTLDRDLIVFGVGVVLYVATVFLHPTLFGVAAISGL
jgi:uncharacterized membrane protein